jgi:hypothetical protein
MSVAILALGTQPSAICERCLQPVEIRSPNVQLLIRDQAGQVLPHALPHDARFPMVHSKSIPHHDRCNMNQKPLCSSLERLTPGKC